jgi:hypothetical protein
MEKRKDEKEEIREEHCISSRSIVDKRQNGFFTRRENVEEFKHSRTIMQELKNYNNKISSEK